MNLKKTIYSRKKLKEDAVVSKTYVTTIQDNNFQEVKITPSECRKSVRTFSRRIKKDKV